MGAVGMELSGVERDFVLEALQKGQRADGRRLLDGRKVRLGAATALLAGDGRWRETVDCPPP